MTPAQPSGEQDGNADRRGRVAIRDGVESDAESLGRLIAQLGYEAPPGEIGERLGAMRVRGERVLVAEIDGEVVGCLTTAVLKVLHRPAPVGRITMMVVEERLRGRGLGRALVEAAERLLAEDGCYMVEVTSRFDREAAHAFYEAQGYEKTGIRLAREF